MKKRKRVIVIGLDGATFDLIKPWAEEGKLPTFKKLMDEGAWGNLKSTVPNATIPAWPSFSTGCNPGKHGFFDFFRVDESYRMNVETRPSRAVMKPTLWEILSKNNKKVGVINVPSTYPPKKVNGYLVSGLLSGTGTCTYPKEWMKTLKEKYGYEVTFSTESGKNTEKFLKGLKRQLHQKESLFLDMMDDNIDFLMMVDNGTDRVQHQCWKFIDNANPLHDDSMKENPILEYYKEVDTFLSEVIKKMNEDTTLFIMSDHGQGPLRYFINLNIFLMKEGYMKVKWTLTSLFKYILFKLGFTPRNGYKILEILGLERKAVEKMQKGGMSLVNKLFFSEGDIDWKRTKAFASGVTGAIRLNLKGREKHGIVSGEDYDKLREEIMKKLSGLTNQNGDNAVNSVMKREEVYFGDYVGNAPDIIAVADGIHEFFGMHGFSFNRVIEPTFGNSGSHRPYGIFMAFGNEIKEGVKLKDLNILDVHPTILYILDTPISSNVDGRILTEIFREDSNFVERKPQYIDHFYNKNEEEKKMIKESIERRIK